MQLTEVFARLKDLAIYEERSATDELVDVVFETNQAEAWQKRMESILGPALKPAGAKSNSQANQLAKPFGGIRPEQTMYYKPFDGYAVMAMFWPWQNGRCISCKIFRTAVVPESSPSLLSRLFKK